MTRLALAAASLAAIALGAAPALAQDQAAARKAVLEGMAGSWSGSGEELNMQTNAMEPTEDSFNFAVISEDGLDFAFWNAEQLTISQATDDGQLHDRSWAAGMLVNERTQPMEGIEGPDAEGDWTLTETMDVTGPDGMPYEQRTTYALEGGVFTVQAGIRPAGSDGDFMPLANMSYTKDQ